MTITSFRNDPADFINEALGGLVATHPTAHWETQGFILADSPATTKDGKPAVAVISGGGSGHEPLHAGFIGHGMLTAAVPGLLFTSPNAVQIEAATNASDNGRGVVHVVKNYTGDVMNFTVAARASHPEVKTVLVADDVATDSDDGPGRRGILGTMIVEKITGSAAARGDDLEEVAQIGQAAADETRSMSAAIAPGALPTSGRETFDLPEGKLEVGVGIHGERGTERVDADEADAIVDKLLNRILEALPEPSEIILTVGGLGGTTMLETNLITGAALRWCAAHNIAVRRVLAGDFVTAVNMHGISLSATVATDERLELLDAPTAAPYWPTVVSDPTYIDATTDIDDAMPNEGEVNTWLSKFVERVIESIDELTELDRTAGDGDFGTNMEAALGAIETPIKGGDADVLAAISRRYLVRAGGTSGAVFGTLFRELATAFSETEDAAAALAQGLAQARTAITDLGGAEVGDNTMVDALAPAAEAVTSHTFDEALAQAHEAAVKGAASTREMIAAKGRASYVGEASRGVVDPGAIVVSFLFGDGSVSDFT